MGLLRAEKREVENDIKALFDFSMFGTLIFPKHNSNFNFHYYFAPLTFQWRFNLR